MTTPLRVLVITKDAAAAQAMTRHLAEEGFQLDWQRAENQADLLAALDRQPDLILAEWAPLTALGVLPWISQHGLDIPCIITSATMGGQTAIEALGQGASDWVSDLARLGQAVRRALESRQRRQQREETARAGDRIALREQAEELAAIYDNAPLIMLLVDGERRVRKANQFAADFANRQAPEMYGLRSGEALRCLHALKSPHGCGYGPSCQDCTIRRTVLDTFETGHSYQQVRANLPFSVHGEEQELTFLLSTTRLYVHEQPLVLVIMLDITAQVWAEKQVEDVISALAQQTEELETLHHIGLEIASHQVDQELELLESIVRRGVELVGGTAGGIYLYRPERDVLEWTVSVETDLAPRGTCLRRGEGVGGRVWASGKPLIVDDYSQWEGRAPVYEGMPFHAIVAVPVVWGDRFLGVLEALADPPRTFTQSDARLLERVAAQAAIALVNAQMLQEERLIRQRLETLYHTSQMLNASLEPETILEQLTDEAMRATRATHGAVLVAHPEQGVFERRVLRGFSPELVQKAHASPLRLNEGLNGQAYRSGQVVCVDDVTTVPDYFPLIPETRSELVVPIIHQGQVIANLDLQSPEVGGFAAVDIDFLQALTNQVAVALTNARLFQAERQQHRLAEALADAAAAITQALHFDKVLDSLLEQVEKVIPAEAANILLIEGETARAVRWRGYDRLGLEDWIANRSFALADYYHLKQMIYSEQPIMVPDTRVDPHWVHPKGRPLWLSYIGTPIIVKKVTVGFLNVNSTHTGRFGPDDVRRLEALAAHAAIAIENAGLYQKLEQHIQNLEQAVKERTKEVRSHAARLEAILQSAADGILVTDQGGEIIQANATAHEWLNQRLSAQDALRLRQTIQDLAQRAAEQPEIVLELEGLDLQARATRIVEPDGKATGVVITIHDVTQLKELDRLKDRFVSNVSHELRTPVTTIKLYAELMRRSPPEEWAEYLPAMEQEAERQARLVEDILQLSRLDSGRLKMAPQPVSLNELAEGVVVSHRALASQHGLTLSTRLASPSPIAQADADQMMQVLNNLVVNAIHYTPSGGSVVVSTGEKTREGRKWAIIQVEDTGIGISAEDMPHLFERFYRGRMPRQMQIAGTGLGLAIVKEIVDMHGGQVTVESQVDVGSTFTVWLPLAGEEGA